MGEACESTEECRDMLSGGRALPTLPGMDALPNGGRRIPPSGATVGDDTVGMAEAD